MPVGDYSRSDVRVVEANETLRVAARRMRDEGVGCLVVMRNERVDGVVTDRDIALRVLKDGLDPDTVVVRDILERAPAVVHANMPLGVVPKMMRRLAIRRLPVVDDQERLTGVVTADDMLRLLAREVTMVGEALAAQAAAEDLRSVGEQAPGAD